MKNSLQTWEKRINSFLCLRWSGVHKSLHGKIYHQRKWKGNFPITWPSPTEPQLAEKREGNFFFCWTVFSDMLITVVSYRTQSESPPYRSISPTTPPGAQWPRHHHVCCPLAPKGPSNMCALLPVFKCESLQTSLMLQKQMWTQDVLHHVIWIPVKTYPGLKYFISQAHYDVWTCSPAHFTHPM